MRVEKTSRGFDLILYPIYPTIEMARLVQCSSVIGDYTDVRPGTSALWIGEHFHLYREDVAKLRDILTRWLNTGKLDQ